MPGAGSIWSRRPGAACTRDRSALGYWYSLKIGSEGLSDAHALVTRSATASRGCKATVSFDTCATEEGSIGEDRTRKFGRLRDAFSTSPRLRSGTRNEQYDTPGHSNGMRHSPRGETGRHPSLRECIAQIRQPQLYHSHIHRPIVRSQMKMAKHACPIASAGNSPAP